MKRQAVIDTRLIRITAAEYALKGQSIYREILLPLVRGGTRAVGNELTKIHKRQNHVRLIRDTLVSNAAGLLMGMLSAQFVGKFFDVKGLNNLWGLLSKHTTVSGNTYQALCFSVEFLVALVVFTLTDHCINEYRSWRRRLVEAEADSQTDG